MKKKDLLARIEKLEGDVKKLEELFFRCMSPDMRRDDISFNAHVVPGASIADGLITNLPRLKNPVLTADKLCKSCGAEE